MFRQPSPFFCAYPPTSVSIQNHAGSSFFECFGSQLLYLRSFSSLTTSPMIELHVLWLGGIKSVDDVINEVIISPGAAFTGIFLIILAEPSGPIVLKLDKIRRSHVNIPDRC